MMESEFETHRVRLPKGVEIVIETVPITKVNDNKTRFNSNNHWPGNDVNSVPDYYQVSDLTQTKHWIDLFHESGSYKIIDIGKSAYAWMREASRVGKITKTFPKAYKEELSDLCEELRGRHGDLLGSRYFVRAENVSLKTGYYGTGPYSTFEEMIISAVTSKEGHSPITDKMEEIRFYLMEWRTIQKFKEFRVFVRDGIVKAISQQALYSSNSDLKKLREESEEGFYLKIVEQVQLIVDYVDEVVIKKIGYITSYCVDLALLENDVPYFIEINPYGECYSSGSSLFHWILDRHIFNDEEHKIYVRFAI
eukprot:TRINITY_DN3944_c0_g1_i1.p1 TRINITY_DN3944_c0_g1~~TRINITY_DN3944_c0_g1_i1.p1  ORF type:complete len:308 (+),score=58.05 TRINITY_DN3944_c0_g1_i1:61-984(+)